MNKTIILKAIKKINNDVDKYTDDEELKSMVWNCLCVICAELDIDLNNLQS